MVDPDGVEQEPEHLAGGDSPRVQFAAIAVVVVLIAGGVLLARAGHHDSRSAAASHRETLPPAPVPTVTADSREVHVGSLFLERVLRCTRTNHADQLGVSLRVTNLSSHALNLLGAGAVTSNSVLVKPTSVRVARGGCVGRQEQTPMRLPPGGAVVVNIEFRVGALCPREVLISARVSFDGGTAGVVHADSSQLANLDSLDFVQCT